MADRDRFNVPEVQAAPEVPRWFTDEGQRFLNERDSDKALPERAKRFICDGYMAFYKSPEVAMYR